jgi:hypothetical protein
VLKIARRANQPSAAQLDELSSAVATAALTAAPGCQARVMDGAEFIQRAANRQARKSKEVSDEPAVATLHPDATQHEVRKSRARQSTRRGESIFLPSWSDMAQALPTAFLRSALFSTGRSVQAGNDEVLAGNKSNLIAGDDLFSGPDLTMKYWGYPLCQFDRQVYSACLDYYREIPLSSEQSTEHLRTSFYEFSGRMGIQYNVDSHRAIRASLLRLSFAQMRLRFRRWNIEVPKLLSISFEDGGPTGDMMGSDILLLRVSVEVAELFGPGAWTAIDREAVRYSGLRGFLASFYGGHSKGKWLGIHWLQKVSRYESSGTNFKASLVRALDKLKQMDTPDGCRVQEYHFSKDGLSVLVLRPGWSMIHEDDA